MFLDKIIKLKQEDDIRLDFFDVEGRVKLYRDFRGVAELKCACFAPLLRGKAAAEIAAAVVRTLKSESVISSCTFS